MDTIILPISSAASCPNVPVKLITIPPPHPILLFGMICHDVPGVNISGHFSPTRYDFPPHTGQPDARAPLIKFLILDQN